MSPEDFEAKKLSPEPLSILRQTEVNYAGDILKYLQSNPDYGIEVMTFELAEKGNMAPVIGLTLAIHKRG